MSEETVKKTLIGKLAEACDAVGGIEKKGRNEMQKYNYVKAADVAKAIRHELFKRGVVVIPSEKEFSETHRIKTQKFVGQEVKEGEMVCWKLVTDYTIHDSESDEKIVITAIGVAMDSGDKAIYKCKTGAIKYFLRTLGLIPDEKDDPEADDSVDEAISGRQSMPKPPIRKTLPIQPVPSVAIKKPLFPELPKEESFSVKFWRTAKAAHKTEIAVREYIGGLGYESTAEIPPNKHQEALNWAAGVDA